MNDVERLGGRVVVLEEGRVRMDSDLDYLRENICLVQVPRRVALDPKMLERVSKCLRVQQHADEWHALYEGDSKEIEKELRLVLNTEDIRCSSLPLEELFVELLGNKHEEMMA